MSEDTSGKVLALSDAESDSEAEGRVGIKTGDLAVELPAIEHYEPLEFNEKRRAELKKTFDFACENGKLDAKQVRAST
eukprot:scaffold14793_cov37-Tisochrysis_lutea.AAC.1